MYQRNCRVAALFFAALITLLFPVSLFAEANTTYNNIIFFGDSLTDNGNLYKHDFGILPKSPPYYKGHFSNGLAWSDITANYYHSMNITSDNYAVGGETTVFHDPFEGFLPYTLTESINNYYLYTAFKDKSHTLYILWIGANDYLNGNPNTDKITSDVVNTIRDSIEGLISRGGKNFLILNIPDLAKTPEGTVSGKSENLSILSTLHNTKLDLAVSKLQDTHKDITLRLFNINQLFTDLLTNPDVFNSKYHTHIKNTTNACWEGGYTIKQLKDQQQLIETQLTADIKMRGGIDAHALTQFITASPDLATAYDVAQRFQKGTAPCEDPGLYVFWDKVHPTAAVHSILSLIITEYIDQNFHRV
jgi:phospholipase/lecithinase/hemolysin